jgi:hypothetical protein
MINIANVLITVLLIAAAAALQIYLSTRKSKWPGLIIPILFILVSLLGIFNIGYMGNAGRTAVLIVQTALIGNIPTAIMFVIYGICRNKKKRDMELEKMNIRDHK